MSRLSAIPVVLSIAALVWLLARMPVEPTILAVRFEPDASAVRKQPLAAGLHVRPVLFRLRRDAGEPHIIDQFLDEPRLIVPKV